MSLSAEARWLLRKVNTLLDNGAKVEVISPELCPGLAANREISISRRAYRPGDLAGAFLAVVATDNRETNHKVAMEARSERVLVNVVDDAEYCDFILPSLVQRGDITIAISTAGKSPALARKLAHPVGERIRRGIRRPGADCRRDTQRDKAAWASASTAETWQEALDLDLLAGLIKKGQTEKARETITRNLLKQHNEVRQV